jgi:hypothetical protein
MVFEVSPQFQAIKRGPRRQVRWRLLLAHDGVYGAAGLERIPLGEKVASSTPPYQ